MSWSEQINGPIRQARMSGSERMNTAFSGSGRVDDDESHPQGQIRGGDEARQHHIIFHSVGMERMG
jgi:hypothetical protein